VRRTRPTLLLATLCLALAAPSSAPAAEAEAADSVHAVGGCALFGADSPWNRRIDSRPVWKRSSAIVAGQAAGAELHLDLGTTEDYYGIPINVVDEDQPLLPLQLGVDGEDYGAESDRGPVFVPADAAAEGGSAADPDPDEGDRHVLALRFTLPTARHAYTWPARHCGPSSNTSADLPTYGMRFRLKASFTARRYSGVERRIVVAMKRYGLVYADQGSAMYVTGTADPRWSDALDQLRAMPLDGRALEVVEPFRRIVRC